VVSKRLFAAKKHKKHKSRLFYKKLIYNKMHRTSLVLSFLFVNFAHLCGYF